MTNGMPGSAMTRVSGSLSSMSWSRVSIDGTDVVVAGQVAAHEQGDVVDVHRVRHRDHPGHVEREGLVVELHQSMTYVCPSSARSAGVLSVSVSTRPRPSPSGSCP